MKRRQRCGQSGIPSGHGSKFDMWFAARTKPPCRQILEPVAPRAGRRRARQGAETLRRSCRASDGRRDGATRRESSRLRDLDPALRCRRWRKRLVIVESPAKARTIEGYLGTDFVVGVERRAHPRPPRARRRRSGEAQEGAVGAPRRQRRERLRAALRRRRGEEEDRRRPEEACRRTRTSSCSRRTRTARARRSPGTSLEVLKPKVPVRRMVFHEITRDAISRALERARATSTSASSTHRRRAASSTGSTATRSRRSSGRRSCSAFRPVACSRSRRASSSSASASAWPSSRRRTGTSRATFDAGPVRGAARRARRQARRAGPGLRPGRESSASATSCSSTRTTARGLADAARGRGVPRPQRREKPYSRRPAAPFMTSTLQQEASRKLRFTAQTTMRVAQRLYENGYITYMRTDSTTLVRVGAQGSPRAGAPSSTARSTSPQKPRQLRAQGEERAGGARGDPAGRRRVPHAAARSRAS